MNFMNAVFTAQKKVIKKQPMYKYCPEGDFNHQPSDSKNYQLDKSEEFSYHSTVS